LKHTTVDTTTVPTSTLTPTANVTTTTTYSTTVLTSNHTATKTSTVTANSSTTTAQDNGSITVLGRLLNGSAPVNGIEVDLRVNGTNVAVGGTPVTFNHLKLGVQYGVVIYWYDNYYIRYINDSNTGMDLQRYDLVTLNSSSPTDNLTGAFEYVPPSKAASLNLFAEYPNGTLIGGAAIVNGYDLHSSGMWLTVTPPFQNTPYTGTFTGGSILPFTLFDNQTYTVNMALSSCGTEQNINGTNIGTVYNVWSHWADNNSTNATRQITLNGSKSLTAVYEQVKPPPCSGVTTTAGASAQISQSALMGLVSIFAVALYASKSDVRRYLSWT